MQLDTNIAGKFEVNAFQYFNTFHRGSQVYIDKHECSSIIEIANLK